jgi:hypothetical protein
MFILIILRAKTRKTYSHFLHVSLSSEEEEYTDLAIVLHWARHQFAEFCSSCGMVH